MNILAVRVMTASAILKLGREARMNIPGTAFGNWEWRFSWDMLPRDLAPLVRIQLEHYGRAQHGDKTYAS